MNFDFDSAQKKLRECESVSKMVTSFLVCSKTINNNITSSGFVLLHFKYKAMHSLNSIKNDPDGLFLGYHLYSGIGFKHKSLGVHRLI